MNLGIDLCGVALKNPVMTASGTFGSGEEYSEFVDLNKLGAVVTKGVANVPWEGNPTPRVAEVYGGMLKRSVYRIRALICSLTETFRSSKNMTRRSSSMSADIRRRNTLMWWNASPTSR